MICALFPSLYDDQGFHGAVESNIESIGAPILFMLLILFVNHTTPKKFWGMEKAGTATRFAWGQL
jgi:hypothetical protein